MKRIALSLFTVALVAGVVAGSAQTSPRTDVKPADQSAREVRSASPYIEIKDEPAPTLIVDPPLPDLLDQGVVWIQWRAENMSPRFALALVRSSSSVMTNENGLARATTALLDDCATP
jgi:Family of unknown function (DUF6130)